MINKVIYGNTVLIDLTNDTVTEDKMYKGTVAHSADGSQIIGTAQVTVDQEVLVIPTGFISVE